MKLDTKNHNTVPKSQWRKWTQVARHTFNEVYGQMTENVGLFLHPAADKKKVKPEHWNTTAWNAAWIAADAVTEGSIV